MNRNWLLNCFALSANALSEHQRPQGRDKKRDRALDQSSSQHEIAEKIASASNKSELPIGHQSVAERATNFVSALAARHRTMKNSNLFITTSQFMLNWWYEIFLFLFAHLTWHGWTEIVCAGWNGMGQNAIHCTREKICDTSRRDERLREKETEHVFCQSESIRKFTAQ